VVPSKVSYILVEISAVTFGCFCDTQNSFHDIRHTRSSILISEGVEIVKVSERLVHVNPKITLKIHVHLVPNNHIDVADIFENALNIPES
jgi:integrase